MASTTIRRLSAVCALALALVACAAVSAPAAVPTVASQPPEGADATARTVDACALVTDAELEEVTGLKVASKGPSTLTTVLPSVCDYEFEAASDFDHASMTLGVRASGGRVFYETYFEPYIDDEIGPLDRAITGVGDKAARGGVDTIMAVKGDAVVDIQYIGLGAHRDEEMPVRLMQLALSKLP